MMALHIMIAKYKGPLNPKNFIHQLDAIEPSDYEYSISIFIIPTIIFILENIFRAMSR